MVNSFIIILEENYLTHFCIQKCSIEHQPEDSFFKKLDSSMKKNTSFVKKLVNRLVFPFNYLIHESLGDSVGRELA